MSRRRGLWLAVPVGAALIPALPGLAQTVRPAELPPQDYAGQQYVDSRGCLFLRAGTPGKTVWISRVTIQGTPICGHPPSGRRVPVAEEGAAVEGPATQPATSAGVAAVPGGYFVAVGSFGIAANVEKALARLRSLDYPATSGKAKGGGAAAVTVLAGPFDSAEAAMRARQDLRRRGFSGAILVGPRP